MGEPGIFWALGSTAWIVVIVAAVLALRRAGAPVRLQVLVGVSALIAGHTPPLGRSACCASPRRAGWCSG